MTDRIKKTLVDSFDIQIKFSSKNLRLLAKSNENVDIDVNSVVSSINFVINEPTLEAIQNLIEILALDKDSATAKRFGSSKDK